MTLRKVIIGTIACALSVYAHSSSSSSTLSSPGAFTFLEGLNLPSNFVTSTSSSSTDDARYVCLKTIERVKIATKDALDGDSSASLQTCASISNICSQCAKCKDHFSNGGAASTTSKNCICVANSDNADITLGDADDCIITPVSSTFAFAIDAAGGDDCIILLGGALTSVTGGAGEDLILLPANGVADVANAATVINGGADDDCIYIADEFSDDTINGDEGNDLIYVDADLERLFLNHVGANGVYEPFINGNDGDDVILFQALDRGIDAYIQGGLGDDLIRLGGRARKVYGNEGADDIEVLNGGSVSDLDAGEDADKVIVAKGARVDNVYGKAGNDQIIVSGRVFNIFAGDDDDSVDIKKGGFVEGTVYGDAGNDYILVAKDARVRNSVMGGEGDDELRILGDADFVVGEYDDDDILIGSSATVFKVYGGGKTALPDDDANGDDRIVVKGLVLAQVFGNGGDDYIEIASSATVQEIFAGDGDDDVYVSGRVHSDVNLNDGDDFVEIASGASVHDDVLGNDGDDYIIVKTENVRGIVHAGNGNDDCKIRSEVPVRSCDNLVQIFSSSSS